MGVVVNRTFSFDGSGLVGVSLGVDAFVSTGVGDSSGENLHQKKPKAARNLLVFSSIGGWSKFNSAEGSGLVVLLKTREWRPKTPAMARYLGVVASMDIALALTDDSELLTIGFFGVTTGSGWTLTSSNSRVDAIEVSTSIWSIFSSTTGSDFASIISLWGVSDGGVAIGDELTDDEFDCWSSAVSSS